MQPFSARPATPPPPPEVDEFEGYWEVVLTPPSQASNCRHSLAPAEDPCPPPTTQSLSLEPSDCSDSPVKQRPKIGEIARYAYTAPSRASSVVIASRPSSSRATSLAVEGLPAAPVHVQLPKPSRARSAAWPSHRFAAFSDSELSHLLKCVSCSLSWTSRKTVAQKMKHIQTCAKKNKFTDETITILIRQELAQSSSASTRAKGKASATEPESRTMLEGAIQDGDGKKRPGPRPKVVESVKELAETKQIILDRARLLLESTSAPDPGISSPLLRSPGPPSLTQPFGDSALARKFRSKAAPEPTQGPIFVSNPSTVRRDPGSLPQPAHVEVLQSPLRTKSFGESVLAKQYGVKGTYIDAESPLAYISSPLALRNRRSDVIDLLSPTLPVMDLPEMLLLSPLGRPGKQTNPVSAFVRLLLFSTNCSYNQATECNSLSSLIAYRHTSSANEADPPRLATSCSRRNTKQDSPNSLSPPAWHEKLSDITRNHDPPISNPYEGDHLEWDPDGAIMHYDPDELPPEEVTIPKDRLMSPLIIPSCLMSTPTLDCKRGRTPPPVIPTDPAPSYNIPVGTPKKKLKKKTIGATTTPVHILDEELFARLKACILSDKQLYLHILRYEVCSCLRNLVRELDELCI